jgi:hypothetical protein
MCENGDITTMVIFDNGLNGTIPDSIGQMTGMTNLVLFGSGRDKGKNDLKGTIPESIRQMTGLINLVLYGNGLTGTIPESIGKMTGLTLLTLEANQLTGTIPSVLANLKQLTTISLSYNKLGGVVPLLPFAQYSPVSPSTGCQLDAPDDCKEFECNHFSCPLPANSDKCTNSYPAPRAGVHCK